MLDLEVSPHALGSEENKQDRICIYTSQENADHLTIGIAFRLLSMDNRTW